MAPGECCDKLSQNFVGTQMATCFEIVTIDRSSCRLPSRGHCGVFVAARPLLRSTLDPSSRISFHAASSPNPTFISAIALTSSKPTVFSGKARRAQLHSDDNALKATIIQNSGLRGCQSRRSLSIGPG